MQTFDGMIEKLLEINRDYEESKKVKKSPEII